MPFIPHTNSDISAMLKTIGVNSIDELFSEIPEQLRNHFMDEIPDGLSEMALTRLMHERADKDGLPLSFIGAGAYEHHIPAAIFDLLSRGEFLTAYTPYQAEASQGSLQVIYEFQTMMANLTGMDVSNASMYDGASSLAEAALMAVRANRQSKSKKILIPSTVHPNYRKTVKTIVSPQEIEIIELAYCTESGCIVTGSLQQYAKQDIAAIVIQQPNFFGFLEDVDAITNWAKQHNIMVIALVNPMSLAILNAPGEWGDAGADICCGEGQPLGVPLSSGGPYFGFLTCKQAIVRQMPGRIVGMTTDSDGKTGFALTLQAREQHIRRSKATSNICTNQGLMVVAATIYMSLLGADGLAEVASHCHHNTQLLHEKLKAVDGVELVFSSPFMHEFVLRLNQTVEPVLTALAKQNIQAGFSLSQDYPELGDCLLVCVTETKTEADIDLFVETLKKNLIIVTKEIPSNVYDHI